MVRLPNEDDRALQELRDDLKARVDEILRDWERIFVEEPWMSLPATHRLDALPDVTRAMCDAALSLDPSRTDAWRQYVLAASEHGEMRRRQGFDKELLFTEHYLLRHAMSGYVLRIRPALAGAAVLRLDAAVTIGTRASLLGFHRSEFEARGRWPAVLEELWGNGPGGVGAT
jgi:hypothetical protein